MGALSSYVITDYSPLCWKSVERVHHITSPEILSRPKCLIEYSQDSSDTDMVVAW